MIFKPYQLQKTVLIFKDYKFKAEIFVCLQILLLVFIANCQYCIYGVLYVILSITQILTIALSHSKSDQLIRTVSMVLGVILLIYLPLDLGLHYTVHYIQESQKIDDDIDTRYYN